MKNKYIYLLLFLTGWGCTDTTNKPAGTETETEETTSGEQTLEQMIEPHIKSSLSIPSDEKFTFKIYKEHMDGDEDIDAVITVNRLEFALESAMKSGNTAKQAEIGFTGNFNYIFYYDGHSRRISPPITISSTPHSPLKVKFENIISEGYKDILVDYTIRNSSFRNYFTVTNHTPHQIFQWKLYDRLGEDNPEAIYIEYGPGSYSLAKDILIYNGNLDNASSVKDINKFDPVISKKGDVLYRFFYMESQGKYFTKK